MGVTVSSPRLLSATASSSSSSPAPAVGSFPGNTVLHTLLQCESFPRAAVLHELSCGVHPQGAVVQEQTPPACMTHGITSPVSKTAPARAHLSTGTWVLPGTCSSAGFPTGHCLLWAYTCSGMSSSMGCRWISAPPWASVGCWGTACLTMVCSTSCRATSASVSGAHPPPPSLTLLSSELSVLSPADNALLLNLVIPEALLPSLLGLALASSGSVLELAGIASVGHGGSFWQLLTRSHPCSPPCY